MKKINTILLLLSCSLFAIAQDSLSVEKPSLVLRGQASALLHGNPDNTPPFILAGRYIPQLYYNIPKPDKKLFDFEASINLTGQSAFTPVEWAGDISPYRLWARYSSKQLEIRVGLQKIDFGPSMMLRSLRWFDQIDPRDPLQITNGVYGGLVRYYFLNNVNIWAWGLYGNKNLKGMEFIPSNETKPEFGGRIQFPVPKGEMGVSFHHRRIDTRKSAIPLPEYSHSPENRISLDIKVDAVVGIWFESVWTHNSADLGLFNDQWLSTFGTDYTFGVGNGLNVTFENLLSGTGNSLSEISEYTAFSALSLRYPLGMFDNLNLISYYDWGNNQLYNFLMWIKQFNTVDFYVMTYWNPDNTLLPTGGGQNLYGGQGLQLMLVYNH